LSAHLEEQESIFLATYVIDGSAEAKIEKTDAVIQSIDQGPPGAVDLTVGIAQQAVIA
jgi:hypothetical protein